MSNAVPKPTLATSMPRPTFPKNSRRVRCVPIVVVLSGEASGMPGGPHGLQVDRDRWRISQPHITHFALADRQKNHPLTKLVTLDGAALTRTATDP